MKNFTLIILLLSFCMPSNSCDRELLIVKTKSNDCPKDKFFDIYLLENDKDNNQQYVVYHIACKDDLKDFSYECLVKKDNVTFMIFREYSSPAGLTKIHYLNITNGVLLSTDFMGETYIPLLLTANFEENTIEAFDIDTGEYSSLLLKTEWQKSKSKKMNTNDYEIIKTISF